MLHAKKTSSSSDFSQEVLSTLLGPAVLGGKKIPVVMVKYERGQYRKKKRVFVSVSTWSQYSKETFYPDAAHINNLHLNILAPVIFLKFPMRMNNSVSLRLNYFIFIGYLKKRRGGGGGGHVSSESPDPLWIRHCL